MLLFLDFETYYDKEYSLRKMTPAEYILDKRFETIMLGWAAGSGKPELIDGPDVGKFLAGLDASQVITVTYNALFDNAILAWVYNFVPSRMVDGLGMARCLLGSRLRKLGLGDVCEHLGLGEKGTEIHNVIGMHRADIFQDRSLWRSFGAYCLNDVARLRDVFTALYDEFPRDEFAIMDSVLRCCIEPRFRCDISLLESHLRDIRAKKANLISRTGADGDAISGNRSFVALLEAQGVKVQTKEGKRGSIPAIAKTDKFMAELLEDPNEEVQCLAAARLGVKSTLEERRSERLLSISNLSWPNSTAMMPIPLRYCGAHTMRLSGDWKINMQNLPSARQGNPILRKSLMAPPGFKVVVGDLAQIEARLVAWFCGSSLLDEFREKRDPYSLLAGEVFGKSVNKTTDDGVPRHIGKAGILGCGYGMGPTKFHDSVLKQSRSMLTAAQMVQLNAVWSPDLAERAVYTYRNRYPTIRSMWRQLDDALQGPWLGKPGVAYRHGPITIGHRDGYGYVAGPGHREIRYPNPRIINDELWWFHGHEPRKIYGAALLENIIQFLARNVIFEIAQRLVEQNGLRFVHQVHDELVFIVPDQFVEHVKIALQGQMRLPPSWCSDLPLDCDIGSAQRYGDCK